MTTITPAGHALYPGKELWYIKINGKILSIWESFGEAVEQVILNC